MLWYSNLIEEILLSSENWILDCGGKSDERVSWYKGVKLFFCAELGDGDVFEAGKQIFFYIGSIRNGIVLFLMELIFSPAIISIIKTIS